MNKIKWHITYCIYGFFYQFSMFQQPFVAWTVARMEFVKQENVAVIRAMSETYAINCLVIHDALNMDNAKMVLAYAHKVGMDDTALCVCIFFFLLFITQI